MISISYRSAAFTSDRSLIDINWMVIAIWYIFDWMSKHGRRDVDGECNDSDDYVDGGTDDNDMMMG